MSKNSSANFYQKNKEKVRKKKLGKGIKIFLKKRKTKSDNMVANDTKSLQMMRSKC